MTLEPEPRSAGTARRTVEALLTSHGLADLVDTATLLVSELVTNAILHTASPVELRCSVGGGWSLIEVSDRSSALPSPRNYDEDALTGRGLGLVELLAESWGIESESQGKSVWFRLVSAAATAAPATELDDPPMPAQEAGGFEVRLLNAPTALVLHTVQHGDSVLRELALATLGADRPFHAEPSRHAAHLDLGPVLRAAEEAEASGLAASDLIFRMSLGSGSAALERLALVEEADRMARDGLLLSAPMLPELRECRRWLMSQIALQEEGHRPSPWRLPDDLAGRSLISQGRKQRRP